MNKPGWLALIGLMGALTVGAAIAGEYEFSFESEEGMVVGDELDVESAHPMPAAETGVESPIELNDNRFYHWRMIGRLRLSSNGDLGVEETLGYEIAFLPSETFAFSLFIESGERDISWFGPLLEFSPFLFSIGERSQIKGGLVLGAPVLDVNEVFTGIRIYGEFGRRFGALFGTRLSILGYEANSFELGAVMRF